MEHTGIFTLEGPTAPEMVRTDGVPLILVGSNNVELEICLPRKKDLLVSDLKESIFKKLGLEPREQALSFHHKSLVDTRPLSDYGIKPRDAIKVDKALLGGCLPRETCYCFELLCCCLLMEA